MINVNDSCIWLIFNVLIMINLSMKKINISITFLIFSFIGIAQHNNNEPLEIFSEKDTDGNTVVYAKNNYWCHESLIIEFRVLKNMVLDVELPYQTVIAPQTKKIKLFTISLKNKAKESAMSYVTHNCHGNIFKSAYKENEVYLLPYTKGAIFVLEQGYGGSFSHYMKDDQYALDFNLPLSTPVTASRSGVVISVKENSSKHGKKVKYVEYGNYVTIYHGDGTFADYFHIAQNGSKVKVGDQIEAGQIIALSGNTGWTSGPHLHFQVYVYTENMQSKTIKTMFLQKDGQLIYLKEKDSYEAYQ